MQKPEPSGLTYCGPLTFIIFAESSIHHIVLQTKNYRSQLLGILFQRKISDKYNKRHKKAFEGLGASEFKTKCSADAESLLLLARI